MCEYYERILTTAKARQGQQQQRRRRPPRAQILASLLSSAHRVKNVRTWVQYNFVTIKKAWIFVVCVKIWLCKNKNCSKIKTKVKKNRKTICHKPSRIVLLAVSNRLILLISCNRISFISINHFLRTAQYLESFWKNLVVCSIPTSVEQRCRVR